MNSIHLHIIMHESFESPGAIETWIENNWFKSSYTRLYNGDNFPELIDFDMLVVMGGPQSPATTVEECSYFNAKKEIAFIQRVIWADKILIGVCLGAQLIGEAMWAQFAHSPHREIGMFPIMLTNEGGIDPIIWKFPEKFLVGHWHGDMPWLTKESKVLAMSEGCPRQIVRYTPKIYGFQCHFEFTNDTTASMILNSNEELEQYKSLPYIQTSEQFLQHDYEQPNALLFGFLDAIVWMRTTCNG